MKKFRNGKNKVQDSFFQRESVDKSGKNYLVSSKRGRLYNKKEDLEKLETIFWIFFLVFLIGNDI